MNGSIILIIILLILIVLSSYFSASETAYSSISRPRLIEISKRSVRQKKSFDRVLKLYKNFPRTLSTILIGNNIVNMASASLAAFIFIDKYGDSGVLIATIIMTLLILVFGEFIPKAMAKKEPEKFALWTSRPLTFLSLLLWPMTMLMTKFVKNDSRVLATEEELKALIKIITEQGELELEEGTLIKSAIEFDDRKVAQSFVRKKDVVSIDHSASIKDALILFKKTGFSRIPVQKKEKIIGIIKLKDIVLVPKNQSIMTFVKNNKFISKNQTLDTALELIQEGNDHMLIVTDKIGGKYIGIITLEDMIEELVGEIYDEHDEIPEIRDAGHHQIVVQLNSNVNDVFSNFEIEQPRKTSKNIEEWILVMNKMKNISSFQSMKYNGLVIEKIINDGKIEISIEQIIENKIE